MKKQTKKQGISYNQYDENVVKKEFLKRKKEKKEKKKKILYVVLFIFVILFYFYSDFSRLKTINIVGNQKINSQVIIDKLSVKTHKDIFLFVNESKVVNEVKKMDFVADAKVKRDLFGNMSITIKEAKPILYTKINNVLYIGDENAKVIIDSAGVYQQFLANVPFIGNVNQDTFTNFLTEYRKLPVTLTNLVSDIKHSPLQSDPFRFEFNMNDGKILYLRYDEMVSQLKDKNYQLIIASNPNAKYYDFVGKYVYSR